MQLTLSRILSLVIALGYAVILVISVVKNTTSTPEAVVRSFIGCAVILIPVALIWFPEQIGSATGFIGHGEVTTETPPVMVSIMGWLFLVGLPLAAYFLMR
jgi:hypothetical protein